MNASGLSPDQVKLQARARELAAGPVSQRAAEVDRTEQYPWENVDLLKDAKLIGMTIPQQYGGQGKGWLDAVLAIEALSASCAVTVPVAPGAPCSTKRPMPMGRYRPSSPSVGSAAASTCRQPSSSTGCMP